MTVPCIFQPLSTRTGDTLFTQQVLKTRFTHSIGLSYTELCPLLEKGQLVCEGAPYSEKPLLPGWELVRPPGGSEVQGGSPGQKSSGLEEWPEVQEDLPVGWGGMEGTWSCSQESSWEEGPGAEP